MTRRIIKRERAKDDLLQHALFIAKDPPDAAVRFLRAADDAFEKLAAFPGMGPLYGFAAPDLADLHFWPIRRFTNFLIFYRIRPDEVGIVRVLHGARDLESAMRE